MVGIIEDFPFTSLLFVVGLLVGTLIGGGGDVLKNYNFIGIGVNPIAFFANYFSDFLTIIAEGIFIGLISGLLFGLIGLIVDFSRKGEY